jgi:hypothetical protein
MVVTNIGTSTWLMVVSDNATPANGTYAWYFNGTAKRIEPLKELTASLPEGEAAGSVIKQKVFSLTGLKYVLTTTIQNQTDYTNMRKAIDTWEAGGTGGTLLYLSIKNEWSGASNLAVKGTEAAPTTQGQFTGKLFNYSDDIDPENVEVRIEFHYTTQ